MIMACYLLPIKSEIKGNPSENSFKLSLLISVNVNSHIITQWLLLSKNSLISIE